MKDEVLVSDDDSGDETSVEDDEMEDLSNLENEIGTTMRIVMKMNR